MKNTKLVLGSLLMIAFMLLNFNAFSQAKPRGDGQKKAQMEQKRDELKAKLNLNSAQSAQFDEITKRNRDEAKLKRQNLPANASQKEKRAIMRETLEKTDAEILAILNPDQQKIYKEEKEKMKQAQKSKAKAKRTNN